MKRYTEEHARQIAKDFAGCTLADSWYLFGNRIRRAIIDSLVMDALVMADVADSGIRLSATELIEFRTKVETALTDGVKRRNAPPRRFLLDGSGALTPDAIP